MIEEYDLRDPYEYALKQLIQVSNRKAVESIPLEQIFEERAGLTIDNFMESLYPLFKSEGLLIENESEFGPYDSNKFYFTEIFPDQPDDTPVQNVVTWEISRREPAIFDSKVVQGGTKQYRPVLLGQVKTNQDRLAVVYEAMYDNLVSFTAWSTNARDARRLASTLENLFLRFNPHFKRAIRYMVYKGRSPTINTDHYKNRRLFGVTLSYLIGTAEPGFIKQDEIVAIKTYSQVVNSLKNREVEKITKLIDK